MPADPITVGELHDVPAPESAVSAQFHQEVANRIVHRFANTTLMNAWPAGDGALAFSADTRDHYRRVGGVWRSLSSDAPVGTIRSTIRTTADPGWLVMDGTVIGDGPTVYPELWSMIPSTWKSGTSLVLPNMSARTVMGAGPTANAQFGGSNSRSIGAGNLPPHSHGADISHSHQSAPGAGGIGINRVLGLSSGWTVNSAAANRVQEWETTVSIGTISTDPDSLAFTDNGPGSSAAFDVTNAHLGVTFQVKATL